MAGEGRSLQLALRDTKLNILVLPLAGSEPGFLVRRQNPKGFGRGRKLMSREWERRIDPCR
jgi:hypothetical protein